MNSFPTQDVNPYVPRLLDAVREFRKVSPRMELGQAQVLFYVLANPGETAAQIAVGCEGVEKNALYKTLRVLASNSAPYGKGEGLGLIEKRPSAGTAAKPGYYGTPRGEALAERLMAVMVTKT